MHVAGVIVRRVHADRLEDSYEKAGKDHYLFAVDQSEYIVDATNQGGMARFVNHSCGCASALGLEHTGHDVSCLWADFSIV